MSYLVSCSYAFLHISLSPAGLATISLSNHCRKRSRKNRSPRLHSLPSVHTLSLFAFFCCPMVARVTPELWSPTTTATSTRTCEGCWRLHLVCSVRKLVGPTAISPLYGCGKGVVGNSPTGRTYYSGMTTRWICPNHIDNIIYNLTYVHRALVPQKPWSHPRSPL
jgi:hypothetical protein